MILRADHVAGSFFVAFGIAIIALSQDLPLGQLSMPGAGFLPEILAVFIIILGASLFLRARESPAFVSIEWDDGRHALQVIAITAIAVALYVTLGFILTMVLMMAALMVIIEHKTVLRAAGYSVGVAIVTYIIFVHLVRSPLPAGVLGYW